MAVKKRTKEEHKYYYYKSRCTPEARARRRELRRTPKGVTTSMWDNMHRRQPDTDITKEWIRDKINNGICELTGLEFNYDKVGTRMPCAPSIDRLNPKEGYFKHNCRIILSWLNMGRCDTPDEYFREALIAAGIALSNRSKV